MNVRLIKNEKDYELALKRLDEIFHAEPGTEEGDELELLAMIIEDYEDKNYPIDSPDPIIENKITIRTRIKEQT